MKKYGLLLLTFLMITPFIFGQKSDYKVVFDITNSDAASQQQIVREVSLIKDANPDAQLEVVVYGHGLDLLSKDKSTQGDAIRKLVSQKGVSFNACHIAMEHNNMSASDLIEGVGTVPDGIYEIITKQRQGWGYIKIAR